ncbi:MAG TPA: ATP-binding protein [Acidimicrobiales bacterium]|nr:ATP-binding protein [Acidimicrobiales bacterium]
MCYSLPAAGTAPVVKVVYERRLPRSPSALQFVRHDVDSALATNGVARSQIDDALLVLSELGTNAMHAIGYEDEIDVRLGIERRGDVIVEVKDPGSGFRLSQALRLPARNEEHGRGLAIVCLLADETTVRRRRRHTVVRATLRAKRSA